MISEVRVNSFPQIHTANTAPVKAAKAQETPQASQPSQDAVDIRPQSKLDKLLAATASEAAVIEQSLDPHEPGEVIVKTKGSIMKSADNFSKRYGATVMEKFDFSPNLCKSMGGEMLHVKLPEGMSTAQAMAAMKDDPSIEYVCPNHTYQLEEPIASDAQAASAGDTKGSGKMPNDLTPDLWGLHNEGQNGGTPDADIDAPEAWNHTTGVPNGSGPVIAIIDTGADINHPDLKANIWTNPGEIAGDGIDNDGNGVIDDVHGFNAYDQSGNVMDTNSHGSHVAGTIAGVANNGQGVAGINWTANLMPVKIFSESGSTSAAAILRGISYADKMGARVTSNSWGGGGANQAIADAFKNTSALHIMSAGNSGTNNDVHPHYPSDYDLDNNIAVAASDRNDNLASFSCYGEKNVDIAAPGKDILSTVPGGGYKVYSGTSMATPHVTGTVGLLLAQDPTMSNDEIKTRIMEGADKKESLEGKVASGGRLNINNALEYNYNPSNVNKA